MKKHLNLRYKKELNQKSTFVAPKASFRAFTEAVVKCASSIHCALALLDLLSGRSHRLSSLPWSLFVCSRWAPCAGSVAAGACARLALANSRVPSGPRRAPRASPSPCSKGTAWGSSVTLQSALCCSTARLQLLPRTGTDALGMCLQDSPALSKPRSAHPCPVPPFVFRCWNCLPPS